MIMNNLLPQVVGDAEAGDGGGRGADDASAPPASRDAVAIDVPAGGEGEASYRDVRGTQWVPDDDLAGFFRSIASVDDSMQKIKEETVQLQSLHIKSKIATNIDAVMALRQEMAAHIATASTSSRGVVGAFEAMDKIRPGKLRSMGANKARMRQTILQAKKKQFKRLMLDFSNLRSTVQDDYKEIVSRRCVRACVRAGGRAWVDGWIDGWGGRTAKSGRSARATSEGAAPLTPATRTPVGTHAPPSPLSLLLPLFFRSSLRVAWRGGSLSLSLSLSFALLSFPFPCSMDCMACCVGIKPSRVWCPATASSAA